MQFLENGVCTDLEILNTIGLTNLPEMTALAASSRLQNAIKYCTKVHKMIRPDKQSIIRLLFNNNNTNDNVYTAVIAI